MDEAEIFLSQGLHSHVPTSILLHFLISRGPIELKLPHQNSGWSAGRYIRWLHQHQDEKERLQLIKGALEAYVQYVRNRGEKEYSPIYILAINNLKSVPTIGA